jgi:hypothetical protein
MIANASGENDLTTLGEIRIGVVSERAFRRSACDLIPKATRTLSVEVPFLAA